MSNGIIQELYKLMSEEKIPDDVSAKMILAALIVAVTETITALYLDPRYVLVAPVLILLAILIVRPWGLFGTVEELRRV